MITKVSTKGMSHEEWLERRRHTIGGSDAGAVLGVNKHKSPYALWCEKTGKVIPEDISEKESVRLGNDLEEYVSQRWQEKTKKKLRRDNHFVYNTEYPFAHVQADRMVVGEDAGFEAKTTSSWEIVQQCRNEDYPDTWYAQCVHGMMVTGKKRWYLGVLCFGHGFFEFTIERDEAEIKALAEAEENFWNLVTTNTPPPVDGAESTTDCLKAILGDSKSGSEIALDGVSYQLELYTSLDEQIKDLQSRMDECKNTIMNYMGDAEKGKFGKITVNFKTQTRNTFDRKAYERDHGAIPIQYFTQSTSRPFKLTVKK